MSIATTDIRNNYVIIFLYSNSFTKTIQRRFSSLLLATVPPAISVDPSSYSNAGYLLYVEVKILHFSMMVDLSNELNKINIILH